jgi:asparagine synthase (glutamine-hydrolysing)
VIPLLKRSSDYRHSITGISGSHVWHLGIAQPRCRRTRIDRVAHRGPDGSSWWGFESPGGPVTLGHRRLAIIDTSDAGLQPMCDPTRQYWLTFNGEIYNYKELRELAARGVAFRTLSDSEVLIQAYIAWGEDCLQRFLGMFALAIWDDRNKRLFLARDRFGIKPLYIAAVPQGLAAASEIKQLHDLPRHGRSAAASGAHPPGQAGVCHARTGMGAGAHADLSASQRGQDARYFPDPDEPRSDPGPGRRHARRQQ